MAGMAYDTAAAERLEAVYLTPDVVAQRADTRARLGLRPGERVLDVGSGPGFLAEEMAREVGPEGRVRGVDLSADMIARASNRNGHAHLDFRTGDAAALDEPDGAWDAVVSTQVAEYVPDTAAHCAEMARVLRPGGRVLVIATDWEALVWYSEHPDRMARVMDAFRPHCAHTSLPRVLGPALRTAGFAEVRAAVFPIVTTDWETPSYCEGVVSFVRAYVAGQGTVPAEVLAAWAAEQTTLAAEGRLFFATCRFVFTARKPAADTV